MPDVLWVDETGKTTVREVDENGDLVVATPTEQPEPAPFAGKGDHDKNGKTGGAAPPIAPKTKHPAPKHRRR
jgi:hypothetical protein